VLCTQKQNMCIPLARYKTRIPADALATMPLKRFTIGYCHLFVSFILPYFNRVIHNDYHKHHVF